MFTCTRLAPSPTGSLHLGHARTFLITWWLARQVGATILMRMEDLDSRRARPETVRLTYEDLRWLGMDWDQGPPDSFTGPHAGSGGEFVQSRRLEHYAAAIERLWRSGAIYPCVCTRADIAAAVAESAGAPQEGDVQVCYPGTCRHRLDRLDRGRLSSVEALAVVRHETALPACWRLRVPDRSIAFDDGLHGLQAWNVDADSGDFPITRFDGTPAYQLAVVADDAAMAVDCVIRGDDLLSSTARQILLYEALGWSVPRFVHVPLVVGADGKRLAKRHGESRIAQFRERGVTAERIVGWAAWRSGQIASPSEMRADELVTSFQLARVPTTPLTLEEADVKWLLEAT